MKFSKTAMAVLKERYLLKNDKGKTIENPKQMFKRVANFIGNDKKQRKEFFEIMWNLEFLPNSPTLMNADTELGQLSACFVLKIEDSIDSIFTALKNSALIHKSGGGTGFSFSKIRPKDDIVTSTSGKASGPVSFMEIFDKSTDVIKQGGCISTSSLVRTDKGVVPIGMLLDCPTFGDCQTKYFVYTNNSFEHAFLAEDNSIAEVYKIKTKIGTEIKATYNHLIGVIDDRGKFSWKRAEDIKNGDWIIHVLGGHIGEDVEFPMIKLKQHFNAKSIKLPKKMNQDLAELLGIYMADGCISGGRIIFAIEDKDIKLQKKIHKLMLKIFGISKSRIEKKKNDNSICLVFHSRDICRYFEKLGWKKDNALNAFIPLHIFQSSKESAFAFLKGLFEGDGDIHIDGYPRLYSISQRLIKDVQQLLLGLEIVSHYHKYDHENRYGNNPLYHLYIIQERSINKFIKHIGFISNRKNNKLKERSKTREFEQNDVIPNQSYLLRRLYRGPGRGCGKNRSKKGANRKLYRSIQHYLSDTKTDSKRNLTRKRLKKLLNNFPELRNKQLLKIVRNEYFYSPVSEISLKRDYTMDIMVPTTEHFVANSILVHNKRRGANMGILRVDHSDIEDFIHCKEKGGFTNFNISVAITDKFIEAVKKNKKFSLINPRSNKVVKKVNARKIFDDIAEMEWKQGDPSLIFIDEMNRKNPTPSIGKFEATNPCGELPLLPYESCNLGSINLGRFVEDGKIYYERLKKVVRLGVDFLDNVIDKNKYPLKEIEEMTKANRKIGLGVMGFADMLIKLGIVYGSEPSLKIADLIIKFISKAARQRSIELGKEKGNFPNFIKSIWRTYSSMRNATVTSIAPTGTLSIIAGCSSGIEPLFALEFERHVLGKKFFEKNPLLNKYEKRFFITAHEISYDKHIKMQSIFQKYVDNSISKTINLKSTATIDGIKKAFMMAYEMKCKGITLYRDKSKKEQVIRFDPSCLSRVCSL